MTAEQFIARLGNPEHQFAETLAFIDAVYEHQPTAFGITRAKQVVVQALLVPRKS